MNDNIAAGAKKQDEERRETFRSGLSDRSRTMSLGALVLIWGVFTEKSGEGIKLTSDLKRALFAVAIGAVLVLVLDFIEYIAGYFSTFPPRAGRLRIERVLNRSVCESSRSVCLGSKILVAVVTLLALCFVLVPSLRSQDNDSDKPFKGTWCSANYTCLKVSMSDVGTAAVRLSFDTPKEEDDCKEIAFVNDSNEPFFSATCGDWGVRARLNNKELWVDLTNERGSSFPVEMGRQPDQ